MQMRRQSGLRSRGKPRGAPAEPRRAQGETRVWPVAPAPAAAVRSNLIWTQKKQLISFIADKTGQVREPSSALLEQLEMF